MKFILMFSALSIINVVFSTIRTIVTIKGNKYLASLLSGGYFAFYNIMLIYTVADFPMWQKCSITFACNVIGVFVVKLIEEKFQTERLWKIEATFQNWNSEPVHEMLKANKIPHSYLENVGKHCVFSIYCESRSQSKQARKVIAYWNGKYFASEAKIL